MDIFKFNNPSNPTRMESGEIINGIKSKMWVERYAEAGEFTLKGSVSSGMREALPLGTFISHINSQEIMIVENHEISDGQDKDSEITITGRGFETFFENRIVGSNKAFPYVSESTDYVLLPGYVVYQAQTLLMDHITATSLIDDNNAIPFVSVLINFNGVSYPLADPLVSRILKVGTLYERLLELLAIDRLGIRVVRPGIWSPLGPTNPDTAVVIHTGSETRNVQFSYDTGEIVTADYLWSNKTLKNAALVTGKWVQTVVNPSEIGINRRMIHIDAHDLDEAFDVAPTGVDLTNIVAAMQQRGLDLLLAKETTALAKVELSKEIPKAKYREDFDVGDVVSILGNYHEGTKMRVSEYVEIEDSEGERSYPTVTQYNI